MDYVVAFRPETAAREQDFGRKVSHRMQAAPKASNFERQGAIQGRRIPCVIRSDHRYIGAEIDGGRGDLARIGADSAGDRGELAGEQENVPGGTSVCRWGNGHAPCILNFLVIAKNARKLHTWCEVRDVAGNSR